MEERTQYLHRVSHPVHGEVEVYASDRYFAVTAAAKEWGVRWSTIARDCRVQQLRDQRRVKVQKNPSGPAEAAPPPFRQGRLSEPKNGSARKGSRGTQKNKQEETADGKADQKRKRHH